VGISPTFENFLGTGTVTTRLSELQTLTGNAYDDSATLITIQTTPGADREAVRDDLPHSTLITRSAQTKSSSSHYSNVKRLYFAAGASLVILGIVAGGILSLNLLLSLIYVQRKPLAVLRAVGATRRGAEGRRRGDRPSTSDRHRRIPAWDWGDPVLAMVLRSDRTDCDRL